MTTSPTASTVPIVSIVIPNYNHAQYVGDAIESVLAQAYQNFEIIVVDDGSTDNSPEVVAQYGDTIRYVWQENRGLSAARNTGIRAAQGRLVCFLDADDTYAPSYLSTLVPVLDHNVNIAAAYCGFQFVDESGRPLPQSQNLTVPAEQFYRKLLTGNFLAAHCMLIRKEHFEEVGLFDETLSACEDWDMWLRIAEKYEIIGTSEILANYRINPGSMSSDPARMLNNRLTVIQKQLGPKDTADGTLRDILANLTEPRCLTEAQKVAYGHACFVATTEYLQKNDQESAHQYFELMARICPSLLQSREIYYELGCGNQPKGVRGNLNELDVKYNANVLLRMLKRLYVESQAPALDSRHRQVAFANAYRVLAQLSIGTGEYENALRYIFRLLSVHPRHSINQQSAIMLVKAIVGIAGIDWIQK